MRKQRPTGSCAICQPHYLPWIGYFEMIDRVDTFVFLDDVQFIKREWKNRNKIRKTPAGSETRWLTVPIEKDSHRALIKDAAIANDRDWVTEHCQAIYHVYVNTPYFDHYYTGIKETIEGFRNESLSVLNVALINFFCKELEIQTRLVKSSDLITRGKKEEKLLNICKALHADFYLANNATGTYVEADYFERHDIRFALQDYKHPDYGQLHKNKNIPFLSHLSVIDILFNQGPKSLEILRKGNPQK